MNAKYTFKIISLTILFFFILFSLLGTYIYFNYKKITAAKSGTSHKLTSLNIKNIEEGDTNNPLTDEKIIEKKNNYGGIECTYSKKVLGKKYISTKECLLNIDYIELNKDIFFKFLFDKNMLDQYIYTKIQKEYKELKDKNINENLKDRENLMEGFFKKKYENLYNINILLGLKKQTGLDKDYKEYLDYKKEIKKDIKKEIFEDKGLTLYLDKIKKDNTFEIKKSYESPYLSTSLLKDKNFQNIIGKINQKKYKKEIEKSSKIFNLDPLLFYSIISVEQFRYLSTYRGFVKSYLQQNYLNSFSKFSYGLGGIKIETYKRINKNLEKYNPEIYKKYFKSDIKEENKDIINQLRKEKEFLYIGALINNIENKRDKAGYNLKDKKGIVITLFNLGNTKKPNNKADVGGSLIKIDDKNELYFGELGLIFYFYFNYYVF